MTREERLKAFTMRLDGRSLFEISAALGYTESAIRSDLMMVIQSGRKSMNIIYPAISRAVQETYGTIRAFSQACGVPYSTSYAVLSGRAAPGRRYREAVCRALGMPEEEVFAK